MKAENKKVLASELSGIQFRLFEKLKINADIKKINFV